MTAPFATLWTLPAWLVPAGLVGVALCAVLGAVVLLRLRRRVDHHLRRTRAELASLRLQLEELQRSHSRPPPVVREDGEFVITSIADGSSDADDSGPVPTVEARLFGDIVLKETVVQAASLAHGLRRALAPETRNRIRFEMKREVKRARKQRRADLREARREWEARQRAGMGVEATEDPAA